MWSGPARRCGSGREAHPQVPDGAPSSLAEPDPNPTTPRRQPGHILSATGDGRLLVTLTGIRASWALQYAAACSALPTQPPSGRPPRGSCALSSAVAPHGLSCQLFVLRETRVCRGTGAGCLRIASARRDRITCQHSSKMQTAQPFCLPSRRRSSSAAAPWTPRCPASAPPGASSDAAKSSFMPCDVT